MDIMDVMDTSDSREEEEEDEQMEEEEGEEYKEEDEETEKENEEEEDEEEQEGEEDDEDTEPEVRTRPRRRSQSLRREESDDVEECASPPRQRRRTSSRLGHGAMVQEQEQGGQVAVDVEAEVQLEPEGSRPQARRKRARREGGAVQGWQGSASVGSPRDSQKGEEGRVVKTVGNDVGGSGGSSGSAVLAGADAVDVTDNLPASSSAPLCDDNGGDSDGSGSAKMEEKWSKKGKMKAKGRRQSVLENMSDSYSDGSGGSDYSGYGDTYAKTRPRSARIQTRRSSAPSPPSLPPATLAEPLEIDNDDDDDDDDVDGAGISNGGVKVTGVQTGQSSSSTLHSPATIAMMPSSDDDWGASEMQRESSFVSTYLGDGIMDIRDRSQRKGAVEGTHKVRLSWATAYLRQECIRAVPHETRLVYPNKDTTGAVRVTRSDLIRLQENVFVNDTIIDFYLRYLLSHDESFGEGLSRSSVHVFSPLVVQAITNVKDAAKPEAYWRKIQKWTKGLDLFSKKVVLFPINSALHWSLVVLFNPDLFKPPAGVPPGNQDGKGSGIASSTDKQSSQGHGGDGGVDGGVDGDDGVPVKVDHNSAVPPPRRDLKDSKNSSDSKDSGDSRKPSEEDGATPPVLPAKATGLTTDGANNASALKAAPLLPLAPHQELPPRGTLGLVWPPISEVGRHTEFVEEILASGGCVSDSPALSPSRRHRGADCMSDAANGTVTYCDISASGGGACKGPMSPNCLVTLKNAQFSPNTRKSPIGHVSPKGHVSSNGKLAFNGKIPPKGRGSRARSARAKGGGDGDGKGGGVDEGYGCSRAGEIIGGGRPTAAPTAAPTTAPTAAPTASSSAAAPKAAPKASPKAAREDAKTAGSCTAQPLDVESSVVSSEPASGTKSGATPASASAPAAAAAASASLGRGTPSGGNPGEGSFSSLPSTTPSSSTASGAVHGNGRRRGNEGGALPPAGGSSNRSQGRPDDAAAEKARNGDDAGSLEQGEGKGEGKENAGAGPEAAVEVSRCSLQGLSGGGGGGVSSVSSVSGGANGGAGAGACGGGGVGSGTAGAVADAASIGGGGDGGGGGKEGLDSSPSPRTAKVADKDNRVERWMHQNGATASSGPALEDGDVGAGRAASVSGAALRDDEPADDSDDTDDLSGARRVPQRTLRSRGHVSAVGETPLPLRIKLKVPVDLPVKLPVKLPVRSPLGGGGRGAGAAPRKARQGKGGGEAGGEEGQQGGPIPCMLLLDSTKGHRSQEVFKMVRKYVEAAWNNSRGDKLGRVSVDAKVLPGCSPPVPLQENDCDCGVYLIHYAKLLLENPPLLTKQFVANGCRGGVFKKKWFDKSAISDTRVSIRSTVESLRWDHVQQERDSNKASASAAASSFSSSSSSSFSSSSSSSSSAAAAAAAAAATAGIGRK